jgi:hypothetical protein
VVFLAFDCPRDVPRISHVCRFVEEHSEVGNTPERDGLVWRDRSRRVLGKAEGNDR